MNKKELVTIIRTEVLLAKSSPERKGYIAGLEEAINIIEGFSNEPQKPVVPQFVADWIERRRKRGEYSLLDAMHLTAQSEDFRKWIMSSKHQEVFARAWLDGYEVEKEKLYTVKIKAVNQYLVKNPDEEFLGFLQSRLKSKFTRKELEDAGFGWVFDCKGIEVEEVE
ncbi:DUF1642 domain-containing protein [Streptococcus gordonii]|mgnify:CR=1 FL=1|uniref:DUF1642 domain-containing protein n=1 Tax=Streptococcus gordonii TaxID=1302 RepID=UPI0022840A31|nr:DUF1642 domain-containing protein [Streptococcus gordonii]MCY7168806.1 DUF1642 domain-containing protein [Streptococcus gordonii]